jgi:hypothetical protein
MDAVTQHSVPGSMVCHCRSTASQLQSLCRHAGSQGAASLSDSWGWRGCGCSHPSCCSCSTQQCIPSKLLSKLAAGTLCGSFYGAGHRFSQKLTPGRADSSAIIGEIVANVVPAGKHPFNCLLQQPGVVLC